MNQSSGADEIYAGFWRRLLAHGLDAVSFLSLLVLVFTVVYGTEYWIWLSKQVSFDAQYGSFDPILDVVPVLLTLLGWTAIGATPGKWVLGCQILHADTGMRIGFLRAILRYAAYLVSALPLGLGFFWMLRDRRHQGWHDKIAKTVVVYELDPASTMTLPAIEKALR